MDNWRKLKWAKYILVCAAVYNLFWGALISVYPQILLFNNPPLPFILILLRCIGMLVGVYGIAYYFASRDPVRYWPLVFVGFLGKLLGPPGALYYIYTGELTLSFLWVNVFNDFIWLIPFGWVLYQVWKGRFRV
jgi:hypothetical protein